MRTFEKVHAERGLTFAVDIPDGLKFRGEAQDLNDLIGNLLDNAGKWAREGVSVRAWREPGPRDATPFLIAEIDDDGPGLDESRARAGARARTSGSTKSRPGSGLGLSIVVELAAIYGGSLKTGRKSARRPAGNSAAAVRVRFASSWFGGGCMRQGLAGFLAIVAAVPRRLFRARDERRTAASAAGRRRRRRRRRRLRSRPARRSAAFSAARLALRSATPTGEAAWRRKSTALDVGPAPVMARARTACSALSNPAPRPARAAAPIRRPSMSPGGRTAARASAASRRTALEDDELDFCQDLGPVLR